jgi:4'-phosphopantetheinyl transferase
MRSPGTVDIWVADLDAVPASLLGVLCEAERERAERLLDERLRKRWAASRAVLRELLGDAMGVHPAALELESGPHGKPRVKCFQEEAPCFNLSHSGPLAVYAIAWDREVGVDVEVLDERRARARNELAIARRLLGVEVAQRLQKLDGAARAREFLAAWVAHEARVKCLGHGLDVVEEGAGRLAQASKPASQSKPDSGGEASGADDLCVMPLELGPRAFAALALRGGVADVRLRRWGER